MQQKRIFIALISLIFSFATTMTYANSDLDYGIYWFGKENTSIKAEAGKVNANYNADKPTVIYVHGWQNGSTVLGSRETFNYSENDSTYGIDNDSADAWINKGWNIGVFYWEQFADETEVKDAEAKIWSNQGPRGMRYKTTDGSYSTNANISVSASELFYQAYASAMNGYMGNNIRIAGHSLGNQMAIAVTEKINSNIENGDLAANLLPSRVALLDPFYSKGDKSFLGDRTTGEVAVNHVKVLRNEGVLFEYYQTSGITDLWIGDANEDLKELTAYVSVRPWYIPSYGIADKHIAAPNLYFLSFNSDAPDEVRLRWWSRIRTGKHALSAATTDARLIEMMSSNYYWDQVEGRYTVSTDDDEFERKNK